MVEAAVVDDAVVEDAVVDEAVVDAVVDDAVVEDAVVDAVVDVTGALVEEVDDESSSHAVTRQSPSAFVQ